MTLKSVCDLALKALERHSSPPDKIRSASRPPEQLHWSAYRATIYDASKMGTIGTYDSAIVIIHEAAGKLKVSMRDIGQNRNQQLSREIQSETEIVSLIDIWYEKIEWWRSRLTMWRLQANHHYVIIQDFTDAYGNTLKAGTHLTFTTQTSLPYQGGYTLQFEDTKIYLQDTVSAAILSDFDLFFEEVTTTTF